MKNKIVFFIAAGIALGALAPSAMAKDCKYFKVVSAQTALIEKVDTVPIEKTLSFPVTVERTSMTSAEINGKATPVLLEEVTSLPVMLEKTTVVKPHHWPLSFGVWP